MFKSISQRLKPNRPTKLFDILQAIYSFTTTALSETPNDSFKILTGVRQGDPESPLLYNQYMDYVLRIYRNECHTQKINYPNLKYRIRTKATTREERTKDYRDNHDADWCGYTDDLALFFESEAGLQNGFDLLHRIFSKRTNYYFFAILNTSKNITTRITLNSLAEVQNKVIENVKTFRRLNQIR